LEGICWRQSVDKNLRDCWEESTKSKANQKECDGWNLQRGIFEKSLLMGRISCFTNMIAIDCIRFTKRIDGTKTEGQINMKQPGSYGIYPHLIESSTSFRSINNVTQHTELCAGIGVH
jgi:hypothetical protein